MTWRTDFENAPRGETTVQNFTHHSNGKQFTKEVALSVPIILSVSGVVIKSHWSKMRGQWSGVAETETPDGWMPWPEPMGESE
jgi:hypothetical protein